MIRRKIVLTVIVAVIGVAGAFARKGNGMSEKNDKYSGYLFAYFEGRGEGKLQEQLRFAVSSDGQNWYALNGNKPYAYTFY